ncbi:hypothetical protein E8E14_013185 [Neopestalotiopsis sp. 37M]|nr:hypothetical protein E8E14_013185 [Neopestalotiopsis sp. 37M]
MAANNGNSTDADRENQDAKWYPQIPLPSELINSYQTRTQLLYPEAATAASPSSLDHQSSSYTEGYSPHSARDTNFAAAANDLINQSLGRTPGGTSVVEPDSVLGESGRLYHGYKEGKYFIPNDAAEQDRLDLQHEVYRLLFDGWLALAPVSVPPKYVLDIATGTGIWAREFAEQNPSSYVIGSDLSAIQPETLLPNLAFTKDDAEDAWVFPRPPRGSSSTNRAAAEGNSRPEQQEKEEEATSDNMISFDYVHLRLVFSCFNDPRIVIQRAFDNLRPGGWLEFQELMPKMHQANPSFQGDALKRWADGCGRGALAVGRDLYVADKYKGWMEEVGFVDVEEKRFVLPAHQWMQDPKMHTIGRFNQKNMLEGVRGAGWMMLKAAGMSPEEIELLISQVHSELMQRNNHVFSYVYVVYGRKPMI